VPLFPTSARAAGFAKGGADITLAEEGGETVLRYSANVDVGGKLATVGSRLIRGVSKRLADDFFAAFVEAVSGAPAEAAPPPTATEVTGPARGLEKLWWLGGALVLAAILAIAFLI
jgi:hypothetical protein